MAVESVAAPQHHWPLRVRAAKPAQQDAIRTIRIGLLGVGLVGQAVARLAADRAAIAHAGIRFQVEQALVRDVARLRHCPTPARITSNPSAFLRGNYDVVIEALDAVEPARTLVARLLGRGTPVVTANKALVAEHGADLQAIAAARGSSFRFEATALSAVPFLGTLADRPFVSSVDRVLAIVNGTSNYLLTSLAEPGATFAQALARSQALLIPVVVFLLVGVLFGVVTLVIGAPALLAEVFLDVVVAGFLSRGLRAHDAQWWAYGVIRRTWKIAVPLAVLLGILGWALQKWSPGIRTLGDAFR